MNPSTTTNKFPTPTAGGSNKAKPRQPLRKARDGHCGELILILDNPMARGALARVSGLLLILAAAPAQAAGVCIVCPPGHTCPAGGAPVLGGTNGQILQRTTTGTQWINSSVVNAPMVCNMMRMGAPEHDIRSHCSTNRYNPMGQGRYCLCTMAPTFLMAHPHLSCPGSTAPIFVQEFSTVAGCTGEVTSECRRRCLGDMLWRIQS